MAQVNAFGQQHPGCRSRQPVTNLGFLGSVLAVLSLSMPVIRPARSAA